MFQAMGVGLAAMFITHAVHAGQTTPDQREHETVIYLAPAVIAERPWGDADWKMRLNFSHCAELWSGLEIEGLSQAWRAPMLHLDLKKTGEIYLSWTSPGKMPEFVRIPGLRAHDMSFQDGRVLLHHLGVDGSILMEPIESLTVKYQPFAESVALTLSAGTLAAFTAIFQPGPALAWVSVTGVSMLTARSACDRALGGGWTARARMGQPFSMVETFIEH